MNFNQILAFIRHSPKVNEIRVQGIFDAESGKEIDKIDLNKMNNERNKLAGVREVVTLYVREKVFLASKWTVNDMKLVKSLTQIKRTAVVDFWDTFDFDEYDDDDLHYYFSAPYY